MLRNKILYLSLGLTINCISFAQKATDSLLSKKQLKAADSLYAVGDYPKAILLFEQDSSVASQLKVAQAYKNVGKLEEALATYQKIVTTQPAQALATFNYATTLLNDKQYKKADSLFEKLTIAYPENLEYVYQLGLSREGQNEMLALPNWMYIIMKDSLHLNANYKLALAFTKSGKFEMAAPYVATGLAQQPNSKRFLTLQGLSFFYEKDYHNTIIVFEKLLALGQSNEQVYEKLAVSYKNTNQYEKSLDTYTFLLEEYDAKNATWHFELGLVYNALGQRDEAVKHIERSKDLLNPSLAGHYMTLATLYKRDGNYKKVFETLKEAVKESPTNEMVLYQFTVAGDTYYKDKNAIIILYETFMTKFPEGRFTELAAQRLSDLKKEVHLEATQKQ